MNEKIEAIIGGITAGTVVIATTYVLAKYCWPVMVMFLALEIYRTVKGAKEDAK